MNKNDFVLAVLAASGGAEHSPVQVQKLFFLIDKKLSEPTGGPFFNFIPYDYGPFDLAVYTELSALALQDYIDITIHQGMNHYRTTPEGQKRGQELLSTLNPTAVEYIKKLSEFVRSLSFAELVSAIYKAYPDMKVNSVFRG